MLSKEQFEEMEHSEHYDAAITSLKYAIESDIVPRKQISFLHAQVNAILAVYKLLLDTQAERKLEEARAYELYQELAKKR